MSQTDPPGAHNENIPDQPWEPAEPSGWGLRQWAGAILAPLILLATLVFDAPPGLSPEGWRTAGVALLMATLWISEAVPIPATALMPLVLFPLLGLGKIKDVAAPYAHPLIFLFLGGFIIALAMQRWGLHRRVALGLIGVMGTRPSRIIGGFLLASALISMWVSNTATALMMLPIALSVVHLLSRGSESGGTSSPQLSGPHAAFGTALMLAVAYGATTGGMATIIGTPPNSLLVGFMDETYGVKISFAQWMALGLPVTLVCLPIVYWVLTRVSFKLGGREEIPGVAQLIQTEKAKLGAMSRGEIIVAIVFIATALCWILQKPIEEIIPAATDTVIAMCGALALFLISVNPRRAEFVMDWEACKGIPWEVLLLFGGGLSLAGNIEKHGVSTYLGSLCAGLEGVPMLLVVCVVCFGILMLTELTSNTATAATFLPVVAAVAISLGQNPLLLVIPTALAANCSYMMPVGTPPNAIVFGSGLIRLPQMAKAGILLNLILVPIIIGLLYLLGPLVFGIEIGKLPAWAK